MILKESFPIKVYGLYSKERSNFEINVKISEKISETNSVKHHRIF